MPQDMLAAKELYSAGDARLYPFDVVGKGAGDTLRRLGCLGCLHSLP